MDVGSGESLLFTTERAQLLTAASMLPLGNRVRGAWAPGLFSICLTTLLQAADAAALRLSCSCLNCVLLLNHPCCPPFLCRLQPPSWRVQPRYVVSVQGSCWCLLNIQGVLVVQLSKIGLCSHNWENTLGLPLFWGFVRDLWDWGNYGLKQAARHIMVFLLYPKAFSQDLLLSPLGPVVGDLI